jgi:hypothetical protein
MGWAILLSLAYIVVIMVLYLQAPDVAADYEFMGENTFILIGVFLIAALFILAMQLAPEDGVIQESSPPPAFSEAPLPPPPPKEFTSVEQEPPAPPPPPQPAEVVEAAVVEKKKITFPGKVEGGLYGDTLVTVSPNTVLQVRSKLADEKDLA